ncbi:MAG TPA: selenide, water dikinase SelD [Flavisolibacter sp.]|jgi:selenide,water dikinase|nr:selenide, water dikinase SelD [Flavisolibacter sp.]
MQQEFKLTEYSKGGGCGCKIAPSVLEQIVRTENKIRFKNLLVGNDSNDDAAVYQINGETAIISTTDFFMPIVDDAFDFGRIAAANSISDIYAMGGTPMMAIAILGWPIDKLPVHVAQQVLEGARAICKEVNIPLAGGHTIDSQDPIFGLAVTGSTLLKDLKQNNTAKAGDLLFLTKPIGVGIVSTSVKRKLIKEDHYKALVQQLTTVNKIGEALGKIDGVHAMTDVTGFGLLGHLTEMAEGSSVSAELNYSSVKRISGVEEYIQLKTIPGATARNWNSYSNKVQFENSVDEAEAKLLLADPQTNGGLLIAVDENALGEVKEIFSANGLQSFLEPIGRCVEKKEKIVFVQ